MKTENKNCANLEMSLSEEIKYLKEGESENEQFDKGWDSAIKLLEIANKRFIKRLKKRFKKGYMNSTDLINKEIDKLAGDDLIK